MNNPQIENGQQVLAISGTVAEPKYINKLEEETHTLRQTYYMWISRFFILTATVSCVFLVLASLSLFRLAPMVTVEPFLLINQSTSEDIVRSEAIDKNMASKDKLLKMFIKQYVVLRNTIINDPIEMRSRWMGGGMLNYLSSPDVYNEFGMATRSLWESIFKQVLVREVEIISINRQGGSRSAVWKVDFKTYDLYNDGGKTQGQQESTLRVRYWTSSITAYFIPDRSFIAPRLINPLGFTVTRYSQTEVEVL
ncbi:MAG: type IV secretion system protein [Alphaproteobacteria bacterium]|nr:type IV secretion system protein [Alphaproteobacteria bacterium]